MIRSEAGGFVFVHIQRTAGMSMEQLLLSRFDDAQHWFGRHGHARDAIGDVGRTRWNGYYSFAFVRNPWDRLVSWYALIQRKLAKLPPEQRGQPAPFGKPLYDQVVERSTDFDSFLDNCTEVVFEQGCYKSFAYNQIDYLCDDRGDIAVDFIGRFERLSEDLAEVGHRLSIPVDELGHVNASEHDHYASYYSTRTRDLVGDRFRRDIETFGPWLRPAAHLTAAAARTHPRKSPRMAVRHEVARVE